MLRILKLRNGIVAARKAGYSDDEIANYLRQSKIYGPKFQAATQAGYSEAEVLRYLGLASLKSAATMLDKLRQRFPEYSNLSDDVLALQLHQRYYADMPFDVFAAKIEYKATSHFDPSKPFTVYTPPDRWFDPSTTIPKRAPLQPDR